MQEINCNKRSNKNMKGQVSIQYILLLSAVIVVSIVLFYAYTHVIGKAEIKPVKTLISYSFSNVNGGNSSFTTITNSNFTKNTVLPVEVRLFFANNTIVDVNASYIIRTKLNITDGKYYYIFNTTTFPVLTKNLTSVMAQLLFIRSNKNYTEPLANTSSKITLYNMSYYNKLPYYLFSLQAVPAKSGTFSPNASGYYKAGTKLSILAVNTSKYGFLKWYGIGNGSYSGTSQLATVEVDSNITEYSYFEPRIPISFKSNYITNFSINSKTKTTPSIQNLTLYGQYTIQFPNSFYNKTGQTYYQFNSLSFCGQKLSSNTYSFTMSESYKNCTFVANYTKEYLLTLKGVNGTILTNASCSSSCYQPSGEKIKITEQPNTNYGFSNFVGTGQNSYTGTNQTANIIMSNPINETAYFVPVEIVYITANKQITFKYNGNTYQTNTSIAVPQNNDFSLYSPNYNTNIPGYYYSSQVSRYPLITNSTGTTCALSGTTFTAVNTTSASHHTCTIQLEEQSTPQYALIFNESLNGGTATPDLNYGSIYFSNGTQAQHINWINANTIVSFYAENNNAGYGFKTFTDEAGTSYDGYTLTGYSGTDGVATTPYPASSNNYEPIGGFFSGYSYDCEPGVLYTSEVVDTINNQPTITLTNPAIETANYGSTNNITKNKTNIKIHYIYYNLTFTGSWSGSGCSVGTYTENLASSRIINQGNITYNVSQIIPYTNYTSGIGEYTLYNITSQYFYSGNTDSWSYSSNIIFFKNSQFLSPEFTSIYQNINNYMNSKFPYSETPQPYQNSPTYQNIVGYWYNLSGIIVYSNYIKGTPNYYLSISAGTVSSSPDLQTENLGISATP